MSGDDPLDFQRSLIIPAWMCPDDGTTGKRLEVTARRGGYGKRLDSALSLPLLVVDRKLTHRIGRVNPRDQHAIFAIPSNFHVDLITFRFFQILVNTLSMRRVFGKVGERDRPVFTVSFLAGECHKHPIV